MVLAKLSDVFPQMHTLKSGAAYYIVGVRNLFSNILLENVESLDTKAEVDGLEPGTQYLFQVTSVGEDEKRRSRKSSPIREETGKALS